MKKDICVLGAGGHSRSLINLLESNNFKIIGLYDDTFVKGVEDYVNGYELKGCIDDVPEDKEIILSVGDCRKRSMLYEKFLRQIYKSNVIHPKAVIENRTKLGSSNQIFSSVYINANASIESDNIINTGCIVEHEAVIGSHNHISVGSVICGRVKIGSRCFVGAGAVVIDKINICDEVMVGAGSVVIKDIDVPGIYVGNPARRIEK